MSNFPIASYRMLDEAIARVEDAANQFEEAMMRFDPDFCMPQEICADKAFDNAYYVLVGVKDRYGVEE